MALMGAQASWVIVVWSFRDRYRSLDLLLRRACGALLKDLKSLFHKCHLVAHHTEGIPNADR